MSLNKVEKKRRTQIEYKENTSKRQNILTLKKTLDFIAIPFFPVLQMLL